jgi:hypothetical protein
VVVGSALAALLYIAASSLPEAPPSFLDRPEIIDKATIRIRSERKWPEKVVLDTGRRMVSVPSIELIPARHPNELLPGRMMDQARLNSLAKQPSDAQPIDTHRRPARRRRETARTFRSTHRARTRNRNQQLTLGTTDCCRFAWEDRTAKLQSASRKRVERRDLWIGWHVPDVD